MSKHAVNADDIISRSNQGTRFMQVAYYNQVPASYEDNQLITKAYVDSRINTGGYPDAYTEDVLAGTLIGSTEDGAYWGVTYDPAVYGMYPNVKLLLIAGMRTAGIVPDVAYVSGEIRIYNLPNNGDPMNLQVSEDTRIVISKS